ncbi:bifunctional lysylphosphatidylglycerol synthetase/lysine--tRNA ligase LysX [Intrasporangium sp.]|uniref:bifunctional lysylphosphatidylglycerol synthetase/lysine--tRNA ligase LysX n=1 Tax=Intrasporangium sp. TaxID=1925024 RepID=UPI003221B573
MRVRRSGRRSSARPARVLTGVYALATLVALGLVLFERPGRPGRGELVFGLFNIPVARSFVSVVVLALVTRALVGRKRVALWLVAGFQLVGVYLGVVALLPPDTHLVAELWRTHGFLGRELDVAGIGIGGLALWWLWTLRPLFPGRLRRGSWWLAGTVLVVGSGVTLATTWLLLGGTDSPRGQLHVVVDTVAAAFGGMSRRVLVEAPHGVIAVTSVLAGSTILLAVGLFLASAKPRNSWSPEREVALRRLLADHGAQDSLGYFATRRDKGSVFSPDGRAAVTYRVVAGVSLASADPVGDRAAWPGALTAWRAEAHEYGWQLGVLSASEAGARAYAAAGLRVMLLGDEAVLEPGRFTLRTQSMSPVRHAAQRATRAGVTVRIGRQAGLTPEELAHVTACARAWLGGQRDRGFSMALNRSGDPADAETLYVRAYDPGGELVGVLGFVPWGRSGVSLDVMRRSPTAPNGVTELMVSELMARCEEFGIRRVSLNFCMFRGVFEQSARIGAGALTRLNASVLGLFDRFWQLERLYRANEKYEPSWVPRFLCYDDALALPQIALAAGAAEGFVPWPRLPTGGAHRLGPEQLGLLYALPEQPAVPARRRSGESRHRLATVERIRAAGADPYPPALPARPVALDELAPGRWVGGVEVSVVGRVRSVRDHGSVVFVTVDSGGATTQAVLEARVVTRAGIDRFTAWVAGGDLLRVDGVTGRSRSGTPSVLVHGWRLEAKALRPIPFRALADPEQRVRRRSLDLLVHPEQAALLRQRSAVVSAVRQALTGRGFLEVETPILQAVHGGASARPFETFSRAYDVGLSLRIAPELFLKRLVVGGFGPIFEIGRSFRNEGVDATHNPEFTSLEAYQPHADYTTMRELAEQLVKVAARAVHGREVIPCPAPGQVRCGLAGVELVDVSGPWPVVDVQSAVSRAVGREVSVETDIDTLVGLARRHGVEVRDDLGPGALVEALYGRLVEANTVPPTFYVDFPVETSPLTRPHRSRPGLVERWDLVIGGMEIGTAYTELTDPVEQRSRLTRQSLRAAAGDPEAMQVDEDFLAALELGMPPTGGLGIGVDRLVMTLTNTPIRSVLAFPFVRPRADAATRKEH